MIIGVPKEIKTLENRVALTPGGAAALVRQGHTVLVETDAGRGSGLFDEEYIASGASMVSAEEAWGAEMVIKVKEPIASEYQYLRDGLLLFTYLHLAAERDLTTALLEGGTTAVAYETVQLANGALPLLMPMSEVAGRMATQEGANFLKKTNGGRGVLLGGTPGVAPARVTVIGGGVVGMNAAKMAIGLGADVTILDVNHQRLQYLDDVYGNRIRTVTSTEPNIREWVAKSDLVVGAVLIPGAKAPSLIVEDMVKTMQEGSVIVDVAIDQGGCCETIKPTTHEDPVFDLHGVVHYGVTNMPGAVPRTSTFALSNQTLPYAIQLANKGLDALRADRALALGLNTYKGKLTCPAVGEAFELFSVSPEDVL